MDLIIFVGKKYMRKPKTEAPSVGRPVRRILLGNMKLAKMVPDGSRVQTTRKVFG